jgi:hypothetical protein
MDNFQEVRHGSTRKGKSNENRLPTTQITLKSNMHIRDVTGQE